ncbi:hypothetical protein Ciccas_002524 [Cichlidogyrus casuarinus]|uniref:Uncharacterized protein n=1 Tax=Cichlidogyrus casuarinus TaxID=1844966 RepID=A0ABD2QGZ9_9PLAT
MCHYEKQLVEFCHTRVSTPRSMRLQKLIKTLENTLNLTDETSFTESLSQELECFRDILLKLKDMTPRFELDSEELPVIRSWIESLREFEKSPRSENLFIANLLKICKDQLNSYLVSNDLDSKIYQFLRELDLATEIGFEFEVTFVELEANLTVLFNEDVERVKYLDAYLSKISKCYHLELLKRYSEIMQDTTTLHHYQNKLCVHLEKIVSVLTKQFVYNSMHKSNLFSRSDQCRDDLEIVYVMTCIVNTIMDIQKKHRSLLNFLSNYALLEEDVSLFKQRIRSISGICQSLKASSVEQAFERIFRKELLKLDTATTDNENLLQIFVANLIELTLPKLTKFDTYHRRWIENHHQKCVLDTKFFQRLKRNFGPETMEIFLEYLGQAKANLTTNFIKQLTEKVLNVQVDKFLEKCERIDATFSGDSDFEDVYQKIDFTVASNELKDILSQNRQNFSSCLQLVASIGQNLIIQEFLSSIDDRSSTKYSKQLPRLKRFIPLMVLFFLSSQKTLEICETAFTMGLVQLIETFCAESGKFIIEDIIEQTDQLIAIKKWSERGVKPK